MPISAKAQTSCKLRFDGDDVRLVATFSAPKKLVWLMLLAALAGAGLWMTVAGNTPAKAQIEGERGIAPINSSGDFEVLGVEVNVEGEDADDARQKGWREAQRLGWQKLAAQMNQGRGFALPDGTLDSMVTAIIVEEEMIGPRRYIATLGVLFDRARAGQILGIGGNRLRSAPLLTIPVLHSGASSQVFETQNDWQRAWAQFRTGDSVIDYVRPSGAGSDSLLLTTGQVTRRSRTWWRLILDQFGAADVIMPIARIERQYPGGPIKGTFTARYGPDNRFLDSFSLTAANAEELPQMYADAVKRMDRAFAGALARGQLAPDPTLVVEDPAAQAAAAAAAAIAASLPKVPDPNGVKAPSVTGAELDAFNAVTPDAAPAAEAPAQAPRVATYTVQFSTPDAAALDSALASVRGASGVQAAATTSMALGGTSVMRVTYSGDLDALAAALQSRGWQVQKGAGALSIRR